MNIKIIVATHKPYQMPDDPIYLPIHVGHAGKLDIGYIGDDTGDNISCKNANYCELTGLYWAWKNLDADYIGLAHYRRHYSLRRKGDKWASILSGAEVETICGKYDLIVPNKRRYYIETIRSHWSHLPYTYDKDLDCLKSVIHEKYPEYDTAFETVMRRTWAYMFNMFILKRELLEEYCTWLFDVLFEVDRRTDTSGYPPMEARMVAFLGEFMIDIWMEKNHPSYCEVPVLFMEKQNWVKKGGHFILRKFSTRSQE